MSDENNEIKNAPPESSSQEGKQAKKEGQDQAKEEWEEVTQGKFKNSGEVAKAYKELEKKYGEQSDEVKQAREFMQVVYPLLDEIKNDPTLFKLLDERLRSKTTPQSQQQDQKPKERDQSDAIRSVASDLLLAKFEGQHGIDKMEPDERRSLRKKIGDAIYELSGTDLNGVDLRKLNQTLENAYILVKAKSKSTASDESDAEDRASISSVPSQGGKSETVLTPEEAKIASKLGLTREQYLKGKKG